MTDFEQAAKTMYGKLADEIYDAISTATMYDQGITGLRQAASNITTKLEKQRKKKYSKQRRKQIEEIFFQSMLKSGYGHGEIIIP